MSFLDKIMEEREYALELKQYATELVEMEDQLIKLQAKAKQLKEGAVDFPDSMSIGEIFDEAQKRMKTAKWAFGLTNKLKNPEDRKKHRRNIIIVMNKLRALIGKLINKLTVEVPDEQEQRRNPRSPQPQNRNPRNPMGREGSMERNTRT